MSTYLYFLQTDAEVIMGEDDCHTWTQPVTFVLMACDQLKIFASSLTRYIYLELFNPISKKGFAMNLDCLSICFFKPMKKEFEFLRHKTISDINSIRFGRKICF